MYFFVVELTPCRFVLLQVLVTSMRSAREYAELPVDPGSRVLGDMQVDLAGDHVYVPTQQKVSA